MRVTRGLLRAGLIGGLVLGGLAGSAAWAGWPFTGRTIDGKRLAKGPVEMSVYEKGRPSQERTFVADSPETKAIGRWLAAHPKGWSIDFNSYAPGRKLTGELFDLNFHDRLVILNYQPIIGSPKRWIQVSHVIEPGDVPAVFGPPGAK